MGEMNPMGYVVRVVEWIGDRLGASEPVIAGVRRSVVAAGWFGIATALATAGDAIGTARINPWIVALMGAAFQGAGKLARDRAETRRRVEIEEAHDAEGGDI